jgi:hypothetical protein
MDISDAIANEPTMPVIEMMPMINKKITVSAMGNFPDGGISPGKFKFAPHCLQ